MENKILTDDKVLFRIAGHLIEVIMPDNKDWRRLLPSFGAFRCWGSHGAGEDILFTLETVNQLEYIDLSSSHLLVESSEIIGYCFRLFETRQHYIVDIQFAKLGVWHRMLCDKSFSRMQAFIRWRDVYAGKVLNAFIMFAFAQSVVLRHTLLIHASAVEKEGCGYAFLGKSGTGKSTHSSLWIGNLDNVRLLNDDNPAVRVEDGKVFIYGTPWSGKTPCYRNDKVPLEAFVRIEQAPFNRFSRQMDGRSLISILSSCSSMRWNGYLYTTLCDILEEIVKKVPVCILECLPDRDAALLCYSRIKEISK
jgi:hypothetical protein